MVRLATHLALALSCAEAMSVTKQLSRQLSHATKDPPKNFLVLRLAHTGSSWLTAMIGAQDETYITREAMYPPADQNNRTYMESLGKQGVLDYLEHVLTKPSGNILKPDKVQFFCHGSEESSILKPAWQKKAEAGVSLVSQAITMDTFLQPKTCECLHKLGSDCPLKFLGMTLDPTSPVLKDNLHEIFTAIQKKHPDMPVLVFRRTNIVKHSLATGGLGENKNGGRYSVALHQEMSVEKFMTDVRSAVAADKVLRQAAEFFPHVKTVSYERLVNDPKPVMEHIFKFLGMAGHFEDWMAELGDKHTPDDLRLLMKNFDEVEHALENASPCLARQLRAKTNENFHEVCEDDYRSVYTGIRILVPPTGSHVTYPVREQNGF